MHCHNTVEEVFRYENGNVTIKKRGANQQSYESETDPLEAQLLNQQQDLQTDQQSQPEIGITEEINQQPTNQIYLDKDFGYLSTDYYLRDASSIFGEWAKQFTPNGVYLMSQMGLDWQYFADKYEQQKTGQELSAQQQQDWSQLSLTERLSAIRNQYGITQPNSGERETEAAVSRKE
ncbi:hypothetical protein AB0758_44125 [Tolypothrix bouteillei VB521301_2]|uniref:hypothetical protein n=1 Tax=Tolypothrix bouteillei TaxID=1246981 RepID=UPI0038B58161